MLRIGTDFSGIGAPEQALIKLGINHKSVFACDYDKYAKQSYLANYNPEIFYDDITTRNQIDTPDVDLYVGGFPCQAFSMAGKRLGFEDTRGTLFFNVLEYLEAKRPKYFILENVKGLTSHDSGKTFSVIIDCLAKTENGQYSFTMYDEGLGYHIYHRVLNTKDYGIPQNRERIFIVGFRDDKHSFKFPKKIPLELKLKDILQDNPDSKYNITQQGLRVLQSYQKYNKFKLLDKDNDIAACISARCNKISNDNNFLEVDEKYYLNDKYIKKLEEYNENNRKRMSTLKVGGDSKDNLIKVKGAALRGRENDEGKLESTLETRKDNVANSITTSRSDSMLLEWVADVRTDEGLRIRENKLSPCLTASKNSESEISRSSPLIKMKSSPRIRRLTPLECLRLQGFPDEFYYKCKEDGLSDTQLYKQAGNSMTVDVMAYLIKEVLKNEI